MNIKQRPAGPLSANCYLIEGEGFAVVIDPSEVLDEAVELLSSDKKYKYILLTHCHFDHAFGAKELSQKTGVRIYAHVEDFEATADPYINLSEPFGFPKQSFFPDVRLSAGQRLPIGEGEIEVIHTPGHTAGSVCYLIGDKLFSGDTLFEGSIGRTDFPSSNVGAMKRSLKLLLALLDTTEVYSGHGMSTTIGREKTSNPFLGYFK